MVNALREELTGKENTLEEMKKALKEVSAFVITSVLNERRRPNSLIFRKGPAKKFKERSQQVQGHVVG